MNKRKRRDNTTSYYNNFVRKRAKLTKTDHDFLAWMDKIEKIVHKQLGLFLIDLPDEAYYIKFMDGVNHRKIAKMIIDDHNNLIDLLLS